MSVSLTMPTLTQHNSKTGLIPVSTSTSAWCSRTCPWKEKGCYAANGPLSLHWKAISSGQRGTSWETFCDQVRQLAKGQLWRHNAAGDLPIDADGRVDHDRLAQLVSANRGRRGFAFTHHDPLVPGNATAIRQANRGGFTVNLSADSLRQADTYLALGIAPVVTVLPKDGPYPGHTPGGTKLVVCPAARRDGVTCATCALCAKSTRSAVIGFPAHGTYAAHVSRQTENL